MPKTIAMQNEELLYADEVKKDEALATLERLRGSVKIKRRLTKEERDKMALSLTPEEGAKILKRYGL